jgi:hypothetical protein
MALEKRREATRRIEEYNDLLNQGDYASARRYFHEHQVVLKDIVPVAREFIPERNLNRFLKLQSEGLDEIPELLEALGDAEDAIEREGIESSFFSYE